MKTSIKDGKLIIEIPMSSPRPSSSGKTMIVASTGGFISGAAKVGDKPISISVNATIPTK